MDILTPYVKADDILREQSADAKTLERLLHEAVAVSELAHTNFQTSAWNKKIKRSINRTTTLDQVIAHIVANGLSREGSVRALNDTGKPSSWPILDYDKTTDFADQLFGGGKALKEPLGVPLTKTRATILISRYSYKLSVITDCLSIGVHVVYMLLASYCMVNLDLRRRVSACWDSITGFFALVQNSEPAMKTLKTHMPKWPPFVWYSLMLRIK